MFARAEHGRLAFHATPSLTDADVAEVLAAIEPGVTRLVARQVLSPGCPTRDHPTAQSPRGRGPRRPRRHKHMSRERRLRGGRGGPTQRHPLSVGCAVNTTDSTEATCASLPRCLCPRCPWESEALHARREIEIAHSSHRCRRSASVRRSIRKAM